MIARAITATPWGIEARPVQVEVDVRCGLPQVQIVGLPDAAVRESKERVRAALKNCGFDLPPRAVVVNLAPADLRKQGNHLDLAIALALLAAHGQLPEEALAGRLLCGELGLDGGGRPGRGGLAIAGLARRLELAEVVLPAANAAEAAALGAVRVVGAGGLGEAIRHLLGLEPLPAAAAPPCTAGARRSGAAPDLAEVRGQEAAKRALEIAAAGGHNIIMIGPPGSGKTLLARCLPGLLPPLVTAEAIEVTKIHSLVAEEPPAGLVRERPFRSPHASVSAPALVGGGPLPRPGEVSLAHCGVLFLDELPEFRRDALEALRQPMEDGIVTVGRALRTVTMPASFTLVAAMNPCPCGYRGHPTRPCLCPPPAVERYRRRLSGPLLDRVDLQVEVPALDPAVFAQRRDPAQGTAALRARVVAARERQLLRNARAGAPGPNGRLDGLPLERACAPRSE